MQRLMRRAFSPPLAVRAAGRDGSGRTGVGLSVLCALLLLGACNSKNPASMGQCMIDMQCGSDAACMNGACVPRSVDTRTLAVEILPRADSTAARTGIPNVALGSGLIALAADDSVVIEGTVTNAPDAHVVLVAVNPIPGQADLQFETELANSKFQVAVGSRLLRSMATIWLIPKADSTEPSKQPPVSFAAMLDRSLAFTFPPASQILSLRGVLRDSFDGPAVGFSARASIGNRVISNVVTTDANGSFQLSVAPGTVPSADAKPAPADGAQNVTIEFTPSAGTSGPRFQTVAFPFATAVANNAQPRVFRMPAFQKPAPLWFAVQAADSGTPLNDVTMRFRTEIPSGDDGVAIYEQVAHSNVNGEVQVSLIPGTATEARQYQISILPMPDSPYGARCIPDSVVTNVGNDEQPQYSATFKLDLKVVLKGTINGNGSSPAATVSVTATPLQLSSLCAHDTAPSPVSATTSRAGYYEMLVDPGTYRLDVDPPTGSDVPRLTQEGDSAVVVAIDSLTNHDVTLPAGEVVEGDVKGPDNLPLGSANVKIFEILCQGATCEGPSRVAPALRAQTRTDMMGHFRAVLPLP